jgi:hypothetical protein
LNIASNGSDSGLQSVTLTGIGTIAEYTIDSLVRFKKTRTPLSDSLTQYLHITSTGQLPLFISSFAISGQDAGQYFISHYPVNPLPPGQSDSIGITYVPTLEGRHTATLTLISNSFFNPVVTISLQGTGTLPHIVVTPALLLFDSTKEGSTVCKTIDIWNPGSDTLRILTNTLTSNDGDFHYTGLTGANTIIPPDHHQTVTVCFTPLQQGFRQARLLLRTNIVRSFETPSRDTAGFITVDIRGTGVPFGVFANSVSGLPFIDSALVGVMVCRMDTLKNNGDADILVGSLVIGGTNGTAFSYNGLPAFPFLLKARSSVWFTICGTPDKQGLLSGTATVSGTTGGSKIAVALPLAIYGFKACIAAVPATPFDGVTLPNNGSDSTICVTVNNCGDIAAVYHVAISGASAADYSVTPAVSGTIAPHVGTALFCVTYKPSTVGASPASLDVTGSEGSIVKVPLNGTDGCAVVTALSDEIGTVSQFVTKNFDVTVTNTGTFDWNPGAAMVTPSTEFQLNGAPTSVGNAPTQTITVHLKFRATTIGTFTAKLTFENAGPCENAPLSVDLSASTVTGSVKETSSEGFSLDQSYPNPTQGNTWFTYSTPRETEISVKLVDMTGKLIRTLITGRVSEGLHTVNFDARDLASGTYVYMLESGSTRLVRQLILAR